MSLSNQVLDFYDDTNKKIFREVGRSIPEDIKHDAVPSSQDLEKMASEEFALVVLTKEGSTLRKYPTRDQASTWLSAQYFEKTAEKLPPVAQKIAAANLKRACAIFGVAPTEKIASVTLKPQGNQYNESLDMTKTAKEIKTENIKEDGSEYFFALHGKYAMPNQEYVKKAEAYFVHYEKEFADASDRHTFANNLIARAQELEVPLEHADTIKKYASASYGDVLDTQIRMRQDLLQGRPELAASLNKLAAHRKNTDAETFAKALYTLDKKASLDRYYGSHIADAFKSTFESRFTKQASAYSWESDASGISVNQNELEKATQEKYDQIKGYFGPSIADQLKKHAVSIFESLPIDAKEVIAKIAKGKN